MTGMLSPEVAKMADPRNAGILFLILGLLLVALGAWVLLAGLGNLGYLLLVGGVLLSAMGVYIIRQPLDS
jgi:hypothetical protein